MEGGVGIGGQAIAADVSQGVSVNAIDENLYQILWIGARMPHLLRWELGEYIKYKHLDLLQPKRYTTISSSP